jgi:hypothetical protein
MLIELKKYLLPAMYPASNGLETATQTKEEKARQVVGETSLLLSI